MKTVLFDSRVNDAQKDFAGGMGVGMYPGGGGIRGKLLRRLYLRDYRPVALNFAYLAAVLRDLGHTVVYAEDQFPEGDVYIFNPSLLTLNHEINQISQVRKLSPDAQIWLVGSVAYGLKGALDERLQEYGCKILIGEPEQLLKKFDEVFASDQSLIEIGSVQNLDELPFPDWSLFNHRRFKIRYDFWRFPTAFIQQSRGCTFKCNYCPYIMVESKTRFREPASVIDEIKYGIKQFGFRSFKFRDPLFGLDRKRAMEVAEGIAKLPGKIQFSVETRIDLMRDETLQALRRAGLTSITVGIETPNDEMLRKYQRAPIKDDRQRDFIARCRQLGVRTVAGFMVGFPEDTAQNIRWVLDYARKLNPTYANFNVVTPYPGTAFYDEVANQIDTHDYSQYSVYYPVMKYKHLTAEQVSELHAQCFTKYYFRSRYFKDNAALLWPWLRPLLMPRPQSGSDSKSHTPETNPHQPLPKTSDGGKRLSILTGNCHSKSEIEVGNGQSTTPNRHVA